MAGKSDGKSLAVEILRNGNAEKKMREIIAAQGGEPEINPEDIAVGSSRFTFRSDRSGHVLWINNASLVDLAKFAGCPTDLGAGVLLHKKVGDIVERDDPLLTIYGERDLRLRRAQERLERSEIMGIGDRIQMLIHQVKERPVIERAFTQDR